MKNARFQPVFIKQVQALKGFKSTFVKKIFFLVIHTVLQTFFAYGIKFSVWLQKKIMHSRFPTSTWWYTNSWKDGSHKSDFITSKLPCASQNQLSHETLQCTRVGNSNHFHVNNFGVLLLANFFKRFGDGPITSHSKHLPVLVRKALEFSSSLNIIKIGAGWNFNPLGPTQPQSGHQMMCSSQRN